MIKEHMKAEFFRLYIQQGLKLSKRKCCRMFTRVEYYPGYGVRLSCVCGESVLVLKRADFPDIKSEKDFVHMAVTKWNDGETNW